jgi:hypothetical protein
MIETRVMDKERSIVADVIKNNDQDDDEKRQTQKEKSNEFSFQAKLCGESCCKKAAHSAGKAIARTVVTGRAVGKETFRWKAVILIVWFRRPECGHSNHNPMERSFERREPAVGSLSRPDRPATEWSHESIIYDQSEKTCWREIVRYNIYPHKILTEIQVNRAIAIKHWFWPKF